MKAAGEETQVHRWPLISDKPHSFWRIGAAVTSDKRSKLMWFTTHIN